jgi:thiol:disulfide interchange protein DsbD
MKKLFASLIGLVLACGMLAGSGSSSPAGSTKPFGRPTLPGAAAQPQFFDSRDQVTVAAKSPVTQAPRGSKFVIAVIFDINRGWHIWTQRGGTPAGVEVFDGAINTEIKAQGLVPAGAAVVRSDFVQWPQPHIGPVSGMASAATFEKRAIAYLPVTVPADAPVGEATITLAATFQACDATTCIAPVFDLELKVALEVVAADSGTNIDAALSAEADFAQFDRAVFERMESNSSEPVRTPTPTDTPTGTKGANEPAPVARPNFFGIDIPQPDGFAGLLVLAAFAALGGLILNLTPCVLPVIPIKVLTISQHAGTPGRSLTLGLWMAAGVVAFWMAIGLPVAFIAGVTDPSRIFGIWWVTLGIGLLIGAMGVGIMGLFTIQLPQSVYMVNPKADTAGGSFLFGVMTAVLGLPCFGFVAGALLAGAATLPAATVMVIFASLGAGMASPYLVMAAKPSLVDRIPRTGPASELVKQVMGLLLLAAALFFVGSGLIALVTERPYLAKQLHWWAVAVCVALAGLWLAWRTFQITRKPIRRVVFLIAGLIIGGVAVLFAIDSTAKAREVWLAHQAAIEASGGSFARGTWNDFTRVSWTKAREEGYITVLDFTAEWCLNCKALKAAVLNREPVKSELAKDDVVLFTVDVTSTNAPGWDFLRELGQTGIPLLAIFPPEAGDSPWQSNAYTSDQVLNALADARAKKLARQ